MPEQQQQQSNSTVVGYSCAAALSPHKHIRLINRKAADFVKLIIFSLSLAF